MLGGMIARTISNPWIAAGVMLQGTFFFIYLALLSRADVSKVDPMLAVNQKAVRTSYDPSTSRNVSRGIPVALRNRGSMPMRCMALDHRQPESPGPRYRTPLALVAPIHRDPVRCEATRTDRRTEEGC
jgi:hypothetical protein